MNLPDSLAISAFAISERLSDETVVLNLQTGRYCGLNSTATRFWELVAEGASVSDAVDRLVEEFDVERAELEADLGALIEELLRLGLIERR